jgi:Ca2+-binding EF-hand superfamily protein
LIKTNYNDFQMKEEPHKNELGSLMNVVKKAFEIYDTDGSGNLDTGELGELLNIVSECIDLPPISDKQLELCFKVLDTEQDGDVEYKELIKNLTKLNDILHDKDIQRKCTADNSTGDPYGINHKENPKFIKGLGKKMALLDKLKEDKESFPNRRRTATTKLGNLMEEERLKLISKEKLTLSEIDLIHTNSDHLEVFASLKLLVNRGGSQGSTPDIVAAVGSLIDNSSKHSKKSSIGDFSDLTKPFQENRRRGSGQREVIAEQMADRECTDPDEGRPGPGDASEEFRGQRFFDERRSKAGRIFAISQAEEDEMGGSPLKRILTRAHSGNA